MDLRIPSYNFRASRDGEGLEVFIRQALSWCVWKNKIPEITALDGENSKEIDNVSLSITLKKKKCNKKPPPF